MLMQGLLRFRHDRSTRIPVVRYAIVLFAVTAGIVVAVAVTLDRNASHSNWQQSTTALSGGAHVGVSAFGTLRSNLQVEASQLATSLSLQRAILAQDGDALRAIAASKHAQIVILRGRAIGTLASGPRIAATAAINDGIRVLARVTVAVPLDDSLLALVRQTTPLPSHAALVLVRNGRVIAGGPRGSRAHVVAGRVTFGKTEFAAQGTALGFARTSILAVEPVAAIDAASDRYRRFVFLAAALTLVLSAALAARLARPLARAVGDVARLTRQVQTDALTNLANRRGLTERLDAELARARENGTSVSFVIADIDDFKLVNDGHGHQTGDHIIRAVGQALAGSVRELDLAARYGGEEFAVVLPGSRLADARRTAERMRRAVSTIEVPSPDGGTARVTMSFGIAEFPTYGGADALVAAADAALYQAKRGGKDQVATATVRRAKPGPAPSADAPAPSTT
jgi:diguanylate cyclase (GGDEF)-like protein